MKIGLLLIVGFFLNYSDSLQAFNDSCEGDKISLSEIHLRFPEDDCHRYVLPDHLTSTSLLTVPTVSTNSATLVTSTTATINGSSNPNGDVTTGWFRYSTINPGTPNDVSGTRIPASSGTSLGSGNTLVPFSEAITGLISSTTYYYWAIAQNPGGTTFGSIQTFTTSPPPPAPIVITNNATLVTASTAMLNGNGNPNGDATISWFRYSTVNPGTPNDAAGIRVPVSGGVPLGSGTSSVDFSLPVSGLIAGTTYYFWAIAQNAGATSFGSLKNFTTSPPPAVPVVITNSATLVTASTATLNGSGNPNGDVATGWFRYSTVNPGTPNDFSGTRAPATGGASLGSGSSPVTYSQPITDLISATTYYCWAIVQNSGGVSFGSIQTFTTSPSPPIPTVMTNSATLVTATTSTINGNANPNGDAATGWFRYSPINPGTPNDISGTRAPVSGGVSLGSGTSTVSYSQSITGLMASTTYYYWTIAQNAGGTSFGNIQTFTTSPLPSIPIVITNNASLVSASAATLNGSGNPNGDAATGWFRYSTVNPGSPNDVSGIRAPASGGVSLEFGTSSVAYSQAISGLMASTTYYFWAIVQNAGGTSFGSIQSFTTSPIPPAPFVITNSATQITSTNAVLNGSSNPNGDPATGWFRYSNVNPGTPNDGSGTRVPASGGSSLGTGTSPVFYSQPIPGLISATTYYYWAIAQNAAATSFGSIQIFNTLPPPPAPIAATNSATLITASTVTFNGSGNPNGDAATGWFRYSNVNPGTPNDNSGTRAPVSGGNSLGSGTSPILYSQATTGLIAGTIYYYWAIVQNAGATSFGSIQTFTTLPPPPAPTVITNVATILTATTATLNGSGNPNGDATTGWFRYSTVNPGTPNDVSGTRSPANGGASLGSGTSPVNYSLPITGLITGTTYYYWAIAQNAGTTSFGSIQSFTTLPPPPAPIVLTNVATLVTSTTATFNGSGNPNGDAATGWFRFSLVNPGTPNDNSGTRAPVSGGVSLGSGTSPVAFSQPISGLTSGTTYYYWAIAQNAGATSFGSIQSFTTSPPPPIPTVITTTATLVTTTTATLNGNGNPNGDGATGWFRYSTVSPGTPNDNSGTRAPASGGVSLGSGVTPLPFSQVITGLIAGTTYYFWTIAQNSGGVGFGSIQTFTTSPLPPPPTVTTNNVTLLTSSTVTINGSGNPNGDAATGWFRYSTISPGTPNDNSGTRAPASGGVSIGSGTSQVSYSQQITGLIASTTYYYWAIAQNASGTSFGSLQSFTTLSESSGNGSVGIGTTTPNATALLDVSSIAKGFLPPRMTASQRDAITSPVQGLVIFCTDCGGGEIEVYNSFGWMNMSGNAPSGTLSIGDYFAGGKIAYIFQPGDPNYIVGQTHGLIAAVSDNSPGLLWGCAATAIPGADGINLGTGNQNTIDIIAGCGTSGIAAKICGDLILNGYNDWYLPSKEELNKLYLNRVAIGSFVNDSYWSSSEFDNTSGWSQNFSNGAQNNLNKATPGLIRSVRAF